MQNGFATRGGALLVALCAGVPQLVAAADKDVEQVIVSASRVPEAAADLALPWTLVDGDAISTTAAVHINQLTQRVPGTWISRGNGQESLPALRSPVFTGAGSCGAFYMAWDGLSLRGPGFCNVNQLFDANSEQAGRIEVLRGPGAAVYGANAVHGVLNVLTPSLDDGPARRLALEGGANDYYRGRLALRGASGAQSLGLFANVASDGGYKDESGYEQQKLTVKHRYDGDLWTVTSALEATNLQQETAGFVTGFEAYRDPASRPANPNPEAYRDSYAVRAYSRFTRSDASRTLAITPYLRRTGMQFLQHFLPWQPVEKNGQDSVGLRLQLNGDEERLRWQSGIDVDLTRGWLREVQDRDFSPNQPAGVHYDYTVDALSAAAFGQVRYELTPRWHLEAGLRLEYNRYDYDNHAPDGSACAPEASNCRFFRPADRRDSFGNGSANLGASYRLGDATHLYARAARGFRPPQAAELYRLQAGQAVADLDSENIDSIDLGLRGAAGAWRYDLSAYSMRKRDVIFQNADRQNVSGARTRHEGLEFSLAWRGERGWYADIAANLARHRYASDARLLGASLSIDGNDIDTAPRRFGSVRLGRDGLIGPHRVRGELEWVHLGPYFVDPDNLHEYAGHDLLNLRLVMPLAAGWQASLRVTNLLDEEYAERADFGFGSYRYFVGEPRGAFLELAWQR
jgi:iron complex outermembrane receptor protein